MSSHRKQHDDGLCSTTEEKSISHHTVAEKTDDALEGRNRGKNNGEPSEHSNLLRGRKNGNANGNSHNENVPRCIIVYYRQTEHVKECSRAVIPEIAAQLSFPLIVPQCRDPSDHHATRKTDTQGETLRQWESAVYKDIPENVLRQGFMYRDECPGASSKIPPPIGCLQSAEKPKHFIPWNRFNPFLKVGVFQLQELLPATIDRIKQQLADHQCGLLHMKLLVHWINNRFNGVDRSWLQATTRHNAPTKTGGSGSILFGANGGTNKMHYVVVMTAACFAFGPDVIPSTKNKMAGSMMEMTSLKYRKNCGYRITRRAIMDFQRFVTIFFDCECPMGKKYNTIGNEAETTKWQHILGREEEDTRETIRQCLDKFCPKIVNRDIFDLGEASLVGLECNLEDDSRCAERLVDKEYFDKHFNAVFFQNWLNQKGRDMKVFSLNCPGFNHADSQTGFFYPDLLVLRSVSVKINNIVFDLENFLWKTNYPSTRNIPAMEPAPLCPFQKATMDSLPSSDGILTASIPDVDNRPERERLFLQLEASAIRREDMRKNPRSIVKKKNEESFELAYLIALKACEGSHDEGFLSLSGADSIQPADGWGSPPNIHITAEEEQVLFYPNVRDSDICAQPDASFQNWANASPLWHNNPTERLRQIWLIEQNRQTEEELWLRSEYRFYDHNPHCSFWDDEIGARPKGTVDGNKDPCRKLPEKEGKNDGTSKDNNDDSENDSTYGVDSNGDDLSSCYLCLGKEYRKEAASDESTHFSMDNLIAPVASTKKPRAANRSSHPVQSAVNRWKEVLPPQEYPVDSDYESILTCKEWFDSKGKEEEWMKDEVYYTAADYVVPVSQPVRPLDDQIPSAPHTLSEVIATFHITDDHITGRKKWKKSKTAGSDREIENKSAWIQSLRTRNMAQKEKRERKRKKIEE